MARLAMAKCPGRCEGSTFRKGDDSCLLSTSFLCPLFPRQWPRCKVTKLTIALPRKVDRVLEFLSTCHRGVREVNHRTDALAAVS
eukprot:CAMPEP_0184465492 /NCGR_PEP_ID=MMETSP0740-20130409/62025_1 /TAXON_ID=385413 /ORGANISM="Thalassiosira miniscula, Strain CCMP1093" /LENGTH=84 /DNA_ID=CAMNT_0026840341 /DNA_START=64 /DNA_END=315 /DNA_ORIENTATION=+